MGKAAKELQDGLLASVVAAKHADRNVIISCVRREEASERLNIARRESLETAPHDVHVAHFFRAGAAHSHYPPYVPPTRSSVGGALPNRTELDRPISLRQW